MVEGGELEGQGGGGGEAVSQEEYLSYQSCVWNHHGHWPEVTLQVVWELHPPSIAAQQIDHSYDLCNTRD